MNSIKEKSISIGLHFCNDVNHSILKKLKICFDIDCSINSIIPERSGLVEVNETLENILFTSDKQQKLGVFIDFLLFI